MDDFVGIVVALAFLGLVVTAFLWVAALMAICSALYGAMHVSGAIYRRAGGPDWRRICTCEGCLNPAAEADYFCAEHRMEVLQRCGR